LGVGDAGHHRLGAHWKSGEENPIVRFRLVRKGPNSSENGRGKLIYGSGGKGLAKDVRVKGAEDKSTGTRSRQKKDVRNGRGDFRARRRVGKSKECAIRGEK